MQPPDITRVFKGPGNELEVEIVFARDGNQSPKEGHTYDEIIVVTDGVIELEAHKDDVRQQMPGECRQQCRRIGVLFSPMKTAVLAPARRDRADATDVQRRQLLQLVLTAQHARGEDRQEVLYRTLERFDETGGREPPDGAVDPLEGRDDDPLTGRSVKHEALELRSALTALGAEGEDPGRCAGPDRV